MYSNCDFLKNRSIVIFRVKQFTNSEVTWLDPDEQTLRSFWTSTTIYPATQCNITEDLNLKQCRCEHLKSRRVLVTVQV